MKLEECRTGLLVSIKPSNKGRKAKSNFGEIVGHCTTPYEGYVWVKKHGMEIPQRFPPHRLIAVQAHLPIVDADEVLKKGIKIC